MLDQKTVDARIKGERQRCIENIKARTKRPDKIWWLSFVDPDKPEGSQFLGALMLHSNGFIEAVTESHMLGINPGGECKGMEIAKEEAIQLIDEKWKGRLLSSQDCADFDAEMNEKMRLDHTIYLEKQKATQ